MCSGWLFDADGMFEEESAAVANAERDAFG